jgi:ketosteroid isomerase-like protein
MRRFHLPRLLVSAFVVAALTVTSFAGDLYAGSDADRASLHKTSEAIRAAFARGDIEAIMAYHHPDVIKALSYDKYLVGRDAVRADLLGTLHNNRLEFVEHHVENLFFQGDTAVEMSTFTIRGTPKSGGEPFQFKGRAMVVYVRYKQSPTGWASIREVVQLAT